MHKAFSLSYFDVLDGQLLEQPPLDFQRKFLPPLHERRMGQLDVGLRETLAFSFRPSPWLCSNSFSLPLRCLLSWSENKFDGSKSSKLLTSSTLILSFICVGPLQLSNDRANIEVGLMNCIFNCYLGFICVGPLQLSNDRLNIKVALRDCRGLFKGARWDTFWVAPVAHQRQSLDN